ncbi:MAG: glycosyltransferase family 4 protein [Chloroherpetonaceae bacterium]
MNNPQRLKILLFAQLPPPYHGTTLMHQLIIESDFTKVFDVHTQLINFADRVEDITGKFSLKKIFRLISYLIQTFQKLISNRFDYCIYPITFTAGPFLRDAALLSVVRLFGVKIIYYAHGNHLPDFRDRSPKWLQKLIDNFFNAAAGAIVVGECLKFNFSRYLPVTRILAVHNAAERLTPVDISLKTKKPDTLQVLYLSNFIRSKGVFVLLESIPKIIPFYPNVHFVFAGGWRSKSDEQEALDFVRNNNLQPYVTWKGVVTGETKSRLFYESDIFVFPTFYPTETFGVVNLEAMQAGLPIITTNHAAIPEVVEDGINGFIIPTQNSDAIAEKVILLCKNPELRAFMRENNIKKYESFYTREKFGERLIEAVEQLHASICGAEQFFKVLP